MPLTPPAPGDTPATVEPDDAQPQVELADMVERLRQAAANRDADAPPTPLFAGTFAMYPTPEGGMVLVVDAVEGPSGPGEYRLHARPGMVRALAAFMGGGGKLGGLLRRLGAGRGE